MDRVALADMIVMRLEQSLESIYMELIMPGRVHSAVIDDLLPVDIAARIHAAFPAPDRMILKSSVKERKHVGAQMDRFDPLLK